jgi:hypothetical protein
LRGNIGKVTRSAQSLGLQLTKGIQTINNIPIADFAEQYKQLLSEDIVLDPSGHRLGSELARDFLYNLKTEAGKGAPEGYEWMMRNLMHQDDRLAYALELHGISLPYLSDDLTSEKIREYAYLKEKSISHDNKKKLQAIKNLRDKIYEDAKAKGDNSEIPEEIWRMYANLSVETRAELVGEYREFNGWDADLLLTKSQMDKIKIKKQEEESAREAFKKAEEGLHHGQIAMSRGIEYPTVDVRLVFDKVSISSMEFEKLKNDGLLIRQPNPYYGALFSESWQMADQEYVWEDSQPKGDLTLEQISIIRKGMKAEREELSRYVKRLEQEEVYHSGMQNNINAYQAPFEESGHKAKYALLHGLAEQLTNSQNKINRIKKQVQEIGSPKSLQYYLDTYSPTERSASHEERSDRAEKLIKKVVPESMRHVFEEEKKQEPSGILQIDGSDASTNHVTDNLDYLDLANHKSDKKSEVHAFSYEDAIGKSSIAVKQDFSEAITVIKDNINTIKNFSYAEIRKVRYDNKMSMFQELIQETGEVGRDVYYALQTIGIDPNDKASIQSLAKVLIEQDREEEKKQETYRTKADEIFKQKQEDELDKINKAKLVSERREDAKVEIPKLEESVAREIEDVEIPKLEESAKKFGVTLKKVLDEDKKYRDSFFTVMDDNIQSQQPSVQPEVSSSDHNTGVQMGFDDNSMETDPGSSVGDVNLLLSNNEDESVPSVKLEELGDDEESVSQAFFSLFDEKIPSSVDSTLSSSIPTPPSLQPSSSSSGNGSSDSQITKNEKLEQSLVFTNSQFNEQPTKSGNDNPIKLESVEKMAFERSVTMHLDQVTSRVDFSMPVAVALDIKHVVIDTPPAGSSSSFVPANVSGVNYLSPKSSVVTTDVAQKFGSVKASEESSVTKPSELPGDKSVGVIENNISTKQKPSKSPTGVSSGSDDVDLPMPQAGLWAKLSGGKAHQEKDGVISAFDMSQIAITGGFDLNFADNTVIGIAGTRNEISLVSEDQKFADMNANVFSGYASFRLKSNLILGVQAGKGWFNSKSDSALKLNNSFASANLKYGISLGHGVVLAPKIGLDFMQIKDGDKVDDRNFSGSASLSLSKRFKISDEIALTPEIHGGFAAVLNGKERALNISKALSNTPDKGTKHMFGFSAKLEGTNKLELDVGYDYTGWKKFGSHQGYLQVKLKF